jgi:hypothetical protein
VRLGRVTDFESGAHRPWGTGQIFGRVHAFSDQQRLRFNDRRNARHDRSRGTEINWHRDHAFEQTGPECDDPFGPVLTPEKDAFAFANSGGTQVGGKAQCRVARFRIGEVAGSQVAFVAQVFAPIAAPEMEERGQRWRVADQIAV